MGVRYLINRLCSGVFLVLLGFPEQAWALQPHGAPEGLYVHQIAHVLFAGALIYLFLHTRRTPELCGKGWKYLQLFCLLFAAWNLLALVGHEAAAHLLPADILNSSSWFGRLAGPATPLKMVYFITKMDHLLYVPALFCLVIALRTFYLETVSGDADEEHLQ
jgi:hypothetical protein